MRPETVSPSSAGRDLAQDIAWGAILILIFVIVCRSWTQIGTVSFVPKLFQDKGWNPTSYGAITAVMWVASAITGVVASDLADRLGRRKVVFWSLIAAVPPLFFLPLAEGWLAAYLLAILVGGLTGANHSIILVIIQDLFPRRKALASGLALGLIFGLGAAAVYLIGKIADGLTLPVTLQLGTLFALAGAFLALALPQTRQK